MLVQIHKQQTVPPYDSRGMIAQAEIESPGADVTEQIQAWFEEVTAGREIRSDEAWAIVEESSDMFILEVKE